MPAVPKPHERSAKKSDGNKVNFPSISKNNKWVAMAKKMEKGHKNQNKKD